VGGRRTVVHWSARRTGEADGEIMAKKEGMTLQEREVCKEKGTCVQAGDVTERIGPEKGRRRTSVFPKTISRGDRSSGPRLTKGERYESIDNRSRLSRGVS